MSHRQSQAGGQSRRPEGRPERFHSHTLEVDGALVHVGRTEVKAEPPGAWEPVTGGGMAGAQAGRAAAVGEPGTGKRGPRQLWPGRGRPWGCHHSTDCKAMRPSPQPSAQEAALEPCVLAICPSARPSIHNYLPFAILVARFVQSLGSPEKKSSLPETQTQESQPHCPQGLGDSAWRNRRPS